MTTPDSPRILGAFDERTPDWLSFYMFTYFTDRDGTTGVDRVVARTAQVMAENDTDDVAAFGVIPLPVIQKYLNFHYSVSLDLFGGETSTNVVAALTGLNTDLRREYIADCQSGVTRWNRILDDAGLPHRLKLPHVAFNRNVGAFAGIEATPGGEMISGEEWQRRKGEWLPTDVDKTYVRSLMRPARG
jgi:benzoyl-CoA 2,3-epoxidase subunit B